MDGLGIEREGVRVEGESSSEAAEERVLLSLGASFPLRVEASVYVFSGDLVKAPRRESYPEANSSLSYRERERVSPKRCKS